MGKEQGPEKINRINSFVNGLFLKAQISSIGQELLQQIREKEQLPFIKEKFHISDDEQAREKLKSLTEEKRELDPDAPNRHKWHKTSSAGYRLADVVEKSFGEDAKKYTQSSTHPLSSNFIEGFVFPEGLQLPVTKDTQYSLEVTHIPADGATKSPREDRVTLKGEEKSGRSWEAAIVTSYGNISYEKNNVGHKLLVSNTHNKEGELVVKNAEFEDIQAFAKLLREAKQLKHSFPPPLEP